jgi:rSAM/selenodomain-associated transferase 1
VVMARWPAPGRCKRRLASSLGAAPAARIQARLARHTLAVAGSLSAHLGFELVLAVDGLAPRAAGRWGAELGADRCLLQGQGGLGLRMHRQFLRAAAEGARRVVLIGSDLPRLEAVDLAAAFEALNRRPAVLGPAEDGGYWLLGLRRPDPRLLGGMAWGSAQVLEQTLAAMVQRGLEPALLPWRGDLDRGEDLRPWR